MKRILLLALALMCFVLPARAEDVCTIDDAAHTARCVTDRSYLRVKCPLDGEAQVTLSVRDEWGHLIYQRDHGLCEGTFRSDDLYLQLRDGDTDYTVTLTVGDAVYDIAVTRQIARLTDSGVCAWGLSAAELSGRSSNKYALILDVDALRGSALTAPLVSGGMQVGEVTCRIDGDELTVSAALTVDGEVVKSSVYVAPDAVTAKTLGTSHFTGRKAKLDRAIPLNGTPYAAVLVQLTVSYDAATALPLYEDEYFLRDQHTLWDLMQMMTANEAVG